MVNMNFGTSAITITGTETNVSSSYYIDSEIYYKKKKSESKKQKRDRVSLELNRKSWVTFNEKKPRIKQVVKPRTAFR